MNQEIPDWSNAECLRLEIPNNVFIPEPELDDFELRVSLAKSICTDCPLKDICLQYGLDTESSGVWGGTYLEEES